MSEQVRMLPADEEAEQGVLSAVLYDNEAYDQATEIVSATDFASARNSRIWSRMRDLRLGGVPIDLVTLSDALGQIGVLEGIGGRAYLAELSLVAPSASQVRQHAAIVRKHKLLRDLIKLGTDLTQSAYELQPPEELIQQFTKKVFDIAWGKMASPWISIDAVVGEAVQYVDRAMQRDGALMGWTTGLTDLDAMLGGLMPSDLVIIGARPSMGKTALACGIALNASQAGAKVGLISLEMSKLQLGIRFLGYEGRTNVSDIRNGRVRNDQWRSIAQASSRLLGRLVWVDDSGIMTMDQMRAKCRQLAASDGLDVLIVDYLQLLSGGRMRDGRAQQVAEISRELKLLAKELNICVVALSQLSRELERREDKRPLLSDLRESGGIEQDADVVCFVYRDELYVPTEENRGIAELIIRKQRNGPIGDVKVAFQEQFARFDNLAWQQPEGGSGS